MHVVCERMCMCVHICVFGCIFACPCSCLHVCLHMPMCVCACVCACVCVCVCQCVYVCACMCTNTNIRCLSPSTALHIIYWVKDCVWTRDSLILASLARRLAQACQFLCGLWGPYLLTSPLHGKSFKHWAVCSGPLPHWEGSLPEQGAYWLNQMCWPGSPRHPLSDCPTLQFQAWAFMPSFTWVSRLLLGSLACEANTS